MKHSNKNQSQVIVLGIALMIFLLGNVSAQNVGGSIISNANISSDSIYTWSCEDRIILDDNQEPGRISYGGEPLIERINNYLFEGEQIYWPTILVLDSSGANSIENVYVTVGNQQGTGNQIEAVCFPKSETFDIINCNAHVGDEQITNYDPSIMSYYECTLTTETSDSMYGGKWITVEAKNTEGKLSAIEENEYWFLNPIIGLNVEGNDEVFDNVQAGETAYSPDIIISSASDANVALDTFISGTDFIDISNNAHCPESNVLNLSRFKYYAQNGNYDTYGLNDSDSEGYRPIHYAEAFFNPEPFYDKYEIIPKAPYSPYYAANIIQENSMTLKIKLEAPAICQGDFDGKLYFWGEAI